MNKMIKIAIISHALVIPVFQNRWKELAKDKDYEVHLLIPKYWEQTWFGEKVIYKHSELHDDNFHVHPLPTTSVRNWVIYLFKSIDIKFRKIKPDLIYIIHEESILIHHQIYLSKKLFAPKAKVIFFSMNARGVPGLKHKNIFKRLIRNAMWINIKKNTDAALAHYPGCLKSLRDGGYQKPIFIQTQVGVDEKLFAPKPEIRKKYRDFLKFDEYFVLGYTGRLVIDKGVDDLWAVFELLAYKYSGLALLLVGNGDLKEDIEQRVQKSGLKERVHITGFVQQDEVPNYMNAMDTFILGSKTMPHWIDTFPLVTVQAQACGIPVISSDSASLPWQLDDTALFYKEGHRADLAKKIEHIYTDGELRHKQSFRGRIRTRKLFCIKAMTYNFKCICQQIMSGKIVYHNNGGNYVQWRAF
jgi:glycosyltransferase involved in cell wall biosynthesis